MPKKPFNPEDLQEPAEQLFHNDAPGADEQRQSGESVRESVHEDLTFLEFEAQILEEQRTAIEQNPEAARRQHFSKKPNLPLTLGACERMALETYSALPYVLPRNFKDKESLEFFYRFLPIRPGLFPDALFEHLFNIKFKKPRNTIDGAIERKEYYPLLRRLVSTLREISYKPVNKRHKIHSRRVFVITDPDLSGLLISRVPEQQKINNYYPDIYAGIRSQKHMMQQYLGTPQIASKTDLMSLGELEMLKQMRYQIQQIIASLQKWKYKSLQERDTIKYLIEELENLLNLDINEYKTKAREQFTTAKTLKDKQIDRVNPGSTSARLVSSFNEIQKRAAEIFQIMRHTGSDLELLENMRQSMEISFNKTRLYLNVFLDWDYFKPFGEQPGGAGYIRKNAASINNELLKKSPKRTPQSLNVLPKDKKNPPKGLTVLLKGINEDEGTPTPFSEWAEAVLSNLRIVYKLNKDISEGKVHKSEMKGIHNRICEYAIRAQLILKYQHIQQVFMQMLDDMLNHPEQTKAKELREKLEKILDDFNPHALGKSFPIREDIKFMDTAFAPMTKLITDAIALTHEWQKEMYDLIGQHYKFKSDCKNRAALTDEEADALIALEDKMNECNKSYRSQIYELLKAGDFTMPVKSLTVQKTI